MADPAYKTADEEDFRSRYSAETRGMPANLAAVASRNLAIEDAGIARVNAAQRLSPGIGGPGSTPATDAQNYDIAGAMDRADLSNRTVAPGLTAPSIADAHADDITQRRAGIASQRTDIMAKLGIISPASAGYSAVVLAEPKQRRQLLENLSALEREDQNLLREHHENALDAARTAHENFARETHIASARDFAGLSNDLLQIQKDPNLKPGTPEHANAILDVATKHPDGLLTQAGQMLMRGVADTHDKAASLKDRAYPASVISQHAKLLLEKGAFGQDVLESTDLYNTSDDKGRSQAKTALDAATANFNKSDAKLSMLYQQFPSLKSSADPSVQQTNDQRSAASPPVDHNELAKKALNDPSASEAHKAAARKILGLK